ncbi:ionotropic receptor 93a [Diachasma alloeum]|uniref:Ionotropic receptor 93a n=1 Tax=Diachasma alloeum TaxID=454923 RepID=A0A4E0RZ80_9HYME|nr:ionotropic receptor 93a [Diachasma alloeum]THK33261.1 ionotropic receptor 93a [Diachasma alloeum]
MALILIVVLIYSCRFVVGFNDFPSLMTANATMVIVIEKTFYERKILIKETSIFTREAYEKSVASFTSAATKIARERMNISGLSIHVAQDMGANLARDYTILLSVATCSSTWELFGRAKKEKLVHLAITDLDCPRLPKDEGISIPLIEPGEELPQIFYDMRISRGLDWKRAIMLFDESFEQDSIGKVVQAFCNELPKSDLGLASSSLYFLKRGKSEISTKRIIKEILAALPPRKPIDDHIIVVAAYNVISFILEAARSLRMLSTGSQWLFVVPDMAKYTSGNVTYLIELLGEGENIAFLYNDTNLNIRSDQSCRTGATCHVRELVGALGIALEKSLSMEIELYNRVTEEEFEQAGTTKFVRSRNFIKYIRASTCGRCIKWTVVSALTWGNRIGSEADIEPHTLLGTGVWTPDPGYESKDYLFPHVMHGFRGKTLPVVTYHNPPWQFQMTKTEEITESTKAQWDGFVFDVFHELSKSLNFTYKIVAVETPPEINLVKSNPLKAAMSAAEKVPEKVTELVRSKSVFIAACAYTVGVYRKDTTIKFTLPMTIQTYGLLAPRPKPLSRVLLFASPYTNESWALLTTAIIIVGPILYLVHTFSPRTIDEAVKNPQEPVYIGLSSPSRCTWYIYGALLQQGGMNLPKTDGARLIVGTWWLVVMVVVATYSGSLVAFLTFPKMEAPIKNVDDVIERRGEITWSLPQDSFIEDFLTVSNEEGLVDYKRLLRGNEPHAQTHDTVSYEDNIHDVKGGKHVVIDWKSSLMISGRNDYIETGRCAFSLGTDVLFLEEPISMVVPTDSPYLGLINVQLQRMHESGLMDKWIANRFPTQDSCSDSLMGGFEAANHKVDLEDMQGIFFILILGYIMGTVILGYEFFRQHRQLAKERKVIQPFVQ